MKKAIQFVVISLVAVLFASCAGLNMTAHKDTTAETKVILKEANYKVVGMVEGTHNATYIFGIGGLSKKSLENNAVSEMYKNANLTGSQQIINVTTTMSVETYLGIYTKKRAIARGYVIEFLQ